MDILNCKTKRLILGPKAGIINMTLNIKSNSKVKIYLTRIRSKLLYILKDIRHFIMKNFTNIKPYAIWVVGSGRSGTDILVHCLDRSIKVKTFNEDNSEAFDNWRLKSFDVIENVIKNSGADLVLFKPIVEAMKSQELMERYPNSKTVFITREYHDAIHSMIKFFGNEKINAINSWIDTDFKNFPLVKNELRELIRNIWKEAPSIENASGIYWLVYNTSYLFMELYKDERVILTDYDSLVLQPEKTLMRVCNFIGLDFSKTMIKNIYSSSVKHKAIPNLHPNLNESCDVAWEQLNQYLAIQ